LCPAPLSSHLMTRQKYHDGTKMSPGGYFKSVKKPNFGKQCKKDKQCHSNVRLSLGVCDHGRCTFRKSFDVGSVCCGSTRLQAALATPSSRADRASASSLLPSASPPSSAPAPASRTPPRLATTASASSAATRATVRPALFSLRGGLSVRRPGGRQQVRQEQRPVRQEAV
jgi:hypothetical protein